MTKQWKKPQNDTKSEDIVNDMEVKEPFYQTNTWYSITVNPDDTHQDAFNSYYPTRIATVYDFFLEHMIDLDNNGVKFSFSMDVSEPHTNLRKNSIGPRIHFHGRIYFRTTQHIMFFLLKWIPEMMLYSLVDIDTCRDIKIWDNYCKKYLKYFVIDDGSKYWSKPTTNETLRNMKKDAQLKIQAERDEHQRKQRDAFMKYFETEKPTGRMPKKLKRIRETDDETSL